MTTIIVESSYSLDSIVIYSKGYPVIGIPLCFCNSLGGVDATSSGYFSVLVFLCATALRKSLSEEVKNGPAGGVNAA